jgi:uncharacterized protein (DUF2141 family)
MKTIFIILNLFCWQHFVTLFEPKNTFDKEINKSISNTLNISINGFESKTGQAYVCLFDNAKGFPNESQTAFKCQSFKITGDNIIVSISDIPSGNYAVAVVHDTNKNGKLDTNFLGIPKEGYGASNNVLPKMTPPKFEASKIIVAGNKEISINLKYAL